MYPKIEIVNTGIRPFWSVMIPTMDRPHYLEQAIESVLKQNISAEEMQIEVIENAVNSKTVRDLVEKIGKGRVGFFRQDGEKSQSEQWNTCIQRAKGRWVHIFHDDDILIPGFYKAYAEFSQKYPQAGLIFCRAVAVDETGKPLFLTTPPPENEASGIVVNAAEHMLITSYITAPAAMVKREVYELIGGADPSFHFALDRELFIRVAFQGPIGYIHDPYVFYRLHTETVSNVYLRQGLSMADSLRIFQRHISKISPEKKSIMQKIFYQKAANQSIRNSRVTLQEHCYWAAFKHALWAIRLKPCRGSFVQCCKVILAFLKLRTYEY